MTHEERIEALKEGDTFFYVCDASEEFARCNKVFLVKMKIVEIWRGPSVFAICEDAFGKRRDVRLDAPASQLSFYIRFDGKDETAEYYQKKEECIRKSRRKKVVESMVARGLIPPVDRMPNLTNEEIDEYFDIELRARHAIESIKIQEHQQMSFLLNKIKRA